jgi:CBS-domain-containing membrane protein
MRRPETGAAPRRSWWLSLLAGDDAADYVKAHGGQAADVMTRAVVSVAEDTPLPDVARLLEERRIKRVPVVRRGKLVGIVSRADLLRGLANAKLPSRKAKADTDRAIQARLLKALERESWVPLGPVNVTVTDGVAHLWGLVDSEEQRRALNIAVERVDGVRGVKDHLGHVPPYLRGT